MNALIKKYGITLISVGNGTASTLDICESSVPSSESSGILNTISFVPDTVCTDIPASPIPAASAMTGTISFSASLSEYSLSKPTVRLVPPANSTLKLSGEERHFLFYRRLVLNAYDSKLHIVPFPLLCNRKRWHERLESR